MVSNLIIVESASKSKTIQKYLNQSDVAKKLGSFKVVASLGHIVDLPRKTLGIDPTTWEMEYVPIEQKKKVIQQLKKEVKAVDMVYLAADPDREGEAIAWHVKNTFKPKKYKRITFHEITPKAIDYALQHPRDLDEALIDAQESRRALDRVVGYKVSPLLWRRFSTGALSAGRVQSVALAELVQRYKEYQAHESTPYWTLSSLFELYKTELPTMLYDSKTNEKVVFNSEKDLHSKMSALLKKTDWTLRFETKTSKQNPSAPYTTSALQQEAYEKYKIPAKQTMSYAQQLYEKGYITYMRTDSVNLSEDAKKEIHEYLQDVFDESYVMDRSFKNKTANAQEAHECIRPSHFNVTSDTLEEEFTPGHRKIYDLIWRKSVASQMPAAEYINYHFHLTNSLKEFKGFDFRGKVSFVQVLGYLEIWQPSQKIQTKEIEQWNELSSKKDLPIHFKEAKGDGDVTRPTGLYNEPGLIKWMEKEGIGRPSTYSTILDKLFTKGYVSKGSNPSSVVQINHYILKNNKIEMEEATLTIGGKEKDRFLPTSLGERVIDYLEEILPSLLDKEFTSQMEEDLDKISRKDTTKKNILDPFYNRFEGCIQSALKEQAKHVNDNIPKEKKELQPSKSNILKEFKSADILQTRYGQALFVRETKKFVSILPFLQWKEKEIEDVTEKDVQFLMKFPIQVNDIYIEMGRYGLYLIHHEKNYHLPKEEWENVYNESITHSKLQTFLVEKPKFVKKNYKKQPN